jgi:hypothetical protein
MKRELVMGRTMFRALGALLLAPALAVAQSGSALRDGVVVDPAAGTAFVMSPSGGIDAIDLATGTSRWKSAAASKPLVVTGDSLVAQAAPGDGEQLVVVALDKADGATKRRTDVALPKDLKAQVGDTPAQKTLVRGLLSGTHVVVAWAIESRLARGVASDNGDVEQTTGAATIDPETGAAAELRGSAAANDVLSGLSASEMTQLRSVDGQHIVRSEGSSDARNFRTPYRWTITTAAGEAVGIVDSPVALAPFVVSGSQLLYVAPAAGYRDGNRFVSEPLRLRAVDLRSGAQLWAVPLLDASFALPPP